MPRRTIAQLLAAEAGGDVLTPWETARLKRHRAKLADPVVQRRIADLDAARAAAAKRLAAAGAR